MAVKLDKVREKAIVFNKLVRFIYYSLQHHILKALGGSKDRIAI